MGSRREERQEIAALGSETETERKVWRLKKEGRTRMRAHECEKGTITLVSSQRERQMKERKREGEREGGGRGRRRVKC